MELLLVDACPRGRGVSRTLELADAFVDAYRESHPGAKIVTHRACKMGLVPVHGDSLARREALIDAAEWSHPAFAPARDFMRARNIIVAAPYWDLSFPAMLKTYIEWIFIREMTFRYENDAPLGLCAGKRALYLTTAGGVIGDTNLGAVYVKETFRMLGIPRFDCIQADRLDMAGIDARHALEAAMDRARHMASTFDP